MKLRGSTASGPAPAAESLEQPPLEPLTREPRPPLRAHTLSAPKSTFQSLLPLLQPGSVVAATVLGATGCVTVSTAYAPDLKAELLTSATLFSPRAITEEHEASILRGAHGRGVLVELSPGALGATTLVTIHGINAAPDTIQPLHERAQHDGARVLTFVYDDRHSRLTDASRSLAGELATWMKEHPGQPLRIQAHSLGGRVALGALHRLNAEGALKSPVELTLLAPPLAGYASANGARFLPDFLARAIGGAMPGKDLGTNSDYQRMLEALELPSSVSAHIYLAAGDTIAAPDSPTNVKIAQHLRARLFWVEGAEHTSVVGRVASGDPAGIVDISPPPLPP